MSPAAKAIAEKYPAHRTGCSSLYWRIARPCDCGRPARVAALAADIDAAMVRAAASAADACRVWLHVSPGGMPTARMDRPDPAAIVAALTEKP